MDADSPWTSRDRLEAVVSLRDRVESSPFLRAMKYAANLGLGATGLGDTSVAWARRT